MVSAEGRRIHDNLTVIWQMQRLLYLLLCVSRRIYKNVVAGRAVFQHGTVIPEGFLINLCHKGAVRDNRINLRGIALRILGICGVFRRVEFVCNVALNALECKAVPCLHVILPVFFDMGAFAAVVYPDPCGGQLANGSRCVIRHNTDIVRHAGMRGVFCQPNNIEFFRSLCQRIDNRFGIVGRAAAIKAGKYDFIFLNGQRTAQRPCSALFELLCD